VVEPRRDAGELTAHDHVLARLREIQQPGGPGDGYFARKAATFDAIAREAEAKGDTKIARNAWEAAQRARWLAS
jgi:hypothetical protein